MNLSSLLELLKNQSTVITEIDGDSMTGDGLYEGDIILAKKKRKFKQGEIVICAVQGYDIPFIKRIYFLKNSRVVLKSSNPAYEDYYTEVAKITILASVRFRINLTTLTHE